MFKSYHTAIMGNVIRALLVVLTVTAAAYDWKYRIIPNWLVLAGVIAGLAVNTWMGGLSGLWLALSGAAFALLIYLPLYALRAMGAGDAKLMAAVGALMGPFLWWSMFVYTIVIGGVAALVAIVVGGRFRRTFRNIWTILTSLARGRRPWAENPEVDVSNERALRLPHAVTIAAGMLAYLILGPLR
ncbi:MAG TPA: prepilin peptidase [Bryobacteraceae bacterium]|nr:prepilin peptidase [Bryobacteraceae bacterium]